MTNMNPQMAEAIKNRRLELGLDLAAFIAATGLTRQGLAPLLAGEERRYQERLTLPVTRVLHWTPDSIERLLNGREPVPNGADQLPPALISQLDGRYLSLEDANGALDDLATVLQRVEALEAAVAELKQSDRRSLGG